jgi:hypothetical protein
MALFIGDKSRTTAVVSEMDDATAPSPYGAVLVGVGVVGAGVVGAGVVGAGVVGAGVVGAGVVGAGVVGALVKERRTAGAGRTEGCRHGPSPSSPLLQLLATGSTVNNKDCFGCVVGAAENNGSLLLFVGWPHVTATSSGSNNHKQERPRIILVIISLLTTPTPDTLNAHHE